MIQITVTFAFDILTPKSIDITYGSWASIKPRKVYLGEISLNEQTRLC